MRPAARTYLDITAHLITTAMICPAIYLITRNLAYAGAFMLGGFLIDLDHLLDYCYYFKSKFSLKYFIYGYHLKSGKVFLLLHSWELGLLILSFALYLKSYFLFSLFSGMMLHLIIDHSQRKNALFYFLTYRFINKFDRDILLAGERERFKEALNAKI